MALGDLLFSRTNDDGDCVVPCCCSVSTFGETITLTISGIVSGGCVLDTLFDNIVIPATVDIVYDSGLEAWVSDLVGSADYSFPCDLDPVIPVQFQCSAICFEGKLNVQVRAIIPDGAYPAYFASFTALGESQPNELECDGTHAICDGTISI